MSMTNAYIPGLRAAVGHGLPGRPQRQSSGAHRGDFGAVVFSQAAPTSGDWVALDGGIWDDRLNSTEVASSAQISDSIATVQGFTVDGISWIHDDSGFIAYNFSTRALRLFRLKNGVCSEEGSITIGDMLTATQALGVAITPDGRRVALQTSGNNFRLYDLSADFSSATFVRAVSLPNVSGTVNRVGYTSDGKELIVSGSPLNTASPVTRLSFCAIQEDGSVVNVPLAAASPVYSTTGDVLLSLDGRYVYDSYAYISGNPSASMVCRWRRTDVGVYVKSGEVVAPSFSISSGFYCLTQNGKRIVRVGSKNYSDPTYYTVYAATLPAGDEWGGLGSSAPAAFAQQPPNFVGRMTLRNGAVGGGGVSLKLDAEGQGNLRLEFNPQRSLHSVSPQGTYVLSNVSSGDIRGIHRPLKPSLRMADGSIGYVKVG